MVFYHQLVTLVPITPPRNLTLLFRQCARTVIDEGARRGSGAPRARTSSVAAGVGSGLPSPPAGSSSVHVSSCIASATTLRLFSPPAPLPLGPAHSPPSPRAMVAPRIMG